MPKLLTDHLTLLVAADAHVSTVNKYALWWQMLSRMVIPLVTYNSHSFAVGTDVAVLLATAIFAAV